MKPKRSYRVMTVCVFVALSACYRPVVAPALPAPVWLEASRGFRVTESVPNGPDRVCVTTKLSGTVDRISADTIFLGRITELNGRAKRQGCVLGVPGYVVADAKAGGHDGIMDEYGNVVVFKPEQIGALAPQILITLLNEVGHVGGHLEPMALRIACFGDHAISDFPVARCSSAPFVRFADPALSAGRAALGSTLITIRRIPREGTRR